MHAITTFMRNELSMLSRRIDLIFHKTVLSGSRLYATRIDGSLAQEVTHMEVVSSEVSVKSGAAAMPAYLAKPATGGPYPALVVVMEAFGLNDQIRRITNQLASEGFVAIAPNLYFRQPNNVVGYNDLPGAFRLMGTVKDDQIVADMSAAIDHLKALKEVVKPSFGTVGF